MQIEKVFNCPALGLQSCSVQFPCAARVASPIFGKFDHHGHSVCRKCDPRVDGNPQPTQSRHYKQTTLFYSNDLCNFTFKPHGIQVNNNPITRVVTATSTPPLMSGQLHAVEGLPNRHSLPHSAKANRPRSRLRLGNPPPPGYHDQTKPGRRYDDVDGADVRGGVKFAGSQGLRRRGGDDTQRMSVDTDILIIGSEPACPVLALQSNYRNNTPQASYETRDKADRSEGLRGG